MTNKTMETVIFTKRTSSIIIMLSNLEDMQRNIHYVSGKLGVSYPTLYHVFKTLLEHEHLIEYKFNGKTVYKPTVQSTEMAKQFMLLCVEEENRRNKQ